MKATNLIQVLIILVVSIRFAVAQVSPQSAPLTKPIAITVAAKSGGTTVAEPGEIESWLISDEDSRWSAEELESLQRVLQDTFGALAANGIDGMGLLDGYRFRHDAGRYLDGVEGRMAKIDHNVGEITLSDMAFTVQDGFAIYHELGHAVDHRLGRQLSEAFHRHTGGGPFAPEEGEEWQTAANHWLRLEGRDDREEATADAFAVLVMVTHAGLKRPIFPHEPVTTDYEGISAALALALRAGQGT